jgi:hypothetical protein
MDATVMIAEEYKGKAEVKRAKVLRKYQLLLIEKIKILKWEGYTETYFFLIEDLWDKHDSPEA